MAATGRQIHDERIGAGMTIKDIQDVCGVSAAAVGKWQRGDSLPTIDNLVILAALWNTTVDQLIVVR